MAAVVLLTACGTEDGLIGGETTTAVDATGSTVNDGTAGAGAVPTVSSAYEAIDYNTAPVASALRSDRNSDAFPPPLIDPDRIVSGGVPPDGIPPIDAPRFVAVDEVDFLEPDEGVIVVEEAGEAKAYPIQILIWHEIVNDEIGGRPVTVTYCPLCNSALAFDRRVGDRLLDFGTSGELYQSALVMYDRQTESLWAHFTGEGLVGHYAGAKLEPVAARTLSFNQVRSDFPEALVLTRDTGASRPYGTNPYIGYDEATSGPIGPFYSGDVDPRLEPKARVVGIAVAEDPVAVVISDPDATSVVVAESGGRDVVVLQRPGLASALDRASVAAGRDVGQTGAFLPNGPDGERLTFLVEGDRFVDVETGSEWNLAGQAIAGELEGHQLESVTQLNTFWFAWSTYYPDTEILEP